MPGLFGRGKRWQKRTLAEDALLKRYLELRKVPSKYAQDSWKESLGQTYGRTIRQLLDSGDLTRPTIRAGLGLARVKDIKPILRQHDLKVSGRKAELIERLLKNAPNEARRLANEVAQDAFVVTEAGKERALRFKRRRADAEQAAQEALQKRDYRRASDVVNVYYQLLPAPLQPGIGMRWSEPGGGINVATGPIPHILARAGDSWMLEGVPAEACRKILLHAAEDALWPGGLPGDRLERLAENVGELEMPGETYVNDAQVWGYSGVTNRERHQIAQDGLEMTRVWHTTADRYVCHVCAPLDAAPEKYWADRFAHGPPAHHGCRCSIGLTAQTDAQLEERYRERQAYLTAGIEDWGERSRTDG